MAVNKDDRLIEHIREKAAEYISKESNRTSLLTVTRAELTHSGKRAMIFFTAYPEKMEGEALKFLKRQRGVLRRYLEDNIRGGYIPTIDFVIDMGEKNRQRLDEISRN